MSTRLCFRCEHRALSLETQGSWSPRCECRDFTSACTTCYMFRPVVPPALRRARHDRRRFGFRTETDGLPLVKQHALPLEPAKRHGARRWVRCVLPEGWEPCRVQEAT